MFLVLPMLFAQIWYDTCFGWLEKKEDKNGKQKD